MAYLSRGGREVSPNLSEYAPQALQQQKNNQIGLNIAQNTTKSKRKTKNLIPAMADQGPTRVPGPALGKISSIYLMSF